MDKNYWLLRLGRVAEYENDALEKQIVHIGFGIETEPKNLKTLEAVSKYLQENGERGTGHRPAQVHKFVNEIKIGDIVVCPFKTQGKKLHIGEVIGDCELTERKRLGRKIKWLTGNEPLSRDEFDEDLLNTLATMLTLSSLNKNDAPKKIEEALKRASHKEKPTAEVEKDSEAEDKKEAEDEKDYRQLILDQIGRKISKNFREHDFEVLIDEILKAKGYETYLSPPGPDGGIDIIAGKGHLGFDSPRIIVQVKSGKKLPDKNELNYLSKKVNEYNDAKGLFVSWHGFKDKFFKKHIRKEFFNVRFWGRDEVLKEFFAVYDGLSESIQAQIPLEQVWVAVIDNDDSD